jgi:hypothetical protein
MDKLGHRLQIVEQLAEEKQTDLQDNQKPIFHVADLGISEDNV